MVVALAERMNWLKTPVESDPFGAQVLALPLAAETIKDWCKDPQVGGRSVFDALEDTDSPECLKLLEGLKNLTPIGNNADIAPPLPNASATALSSPSRPALKKSSPPKKIITVSGLKPGICKLF